MDDPMLPARGSAGDRTVTAYYEQMVDGGPRLSDLPIFRPLPRDMRDRLDNLPPNERKKVFRYWAIGCRSDPAGEDVFERCTICGAEDFRGPGGRIHKLQHDPLKHYTAETGRSVGDAPADARVRRTGDIDPGAPVTVRQYMERRTQPRLEGLP